MTRFRILIALLLAGLVGCGGEPIERHRSEGKEYYNDGNYREARKEFVAGLELDPADQDLLYFAGMAYQKDYMYDSAMYYLKRADIMNPDNREINQQILNLAIQLADYENAIAAINVLARTGDGFEKYYEQLADLYDKSDQPGLSFYWARKATVAGTDIPEIYLMAASRAADYDSIGVAMELLDTAMARWPNDPRFAGTKALLSFHQGRLTQAEAILRPLIDSNPPNVQSYRLTLARVLGAQKSKTKKREALEILRSLQPSIPPQARLDTIITRLEGEL